MNVKGENMFERLLIIIEKKRAEILFHDRHIFTSFYTILFLPLLEFLFSLEK